MAKVSMVCKTRVGTMPCKQPCPTTRPQLALWARLLHIPCGTLNPEP